MMPNSKNFSKILKESDEVKAVVLRINSPGGTTTGGEALYLRIRELADKKPVVAVFGTVAASAAYMAGIGADHIVTRGSSITGSVGVIVQWPDVSDLMGKLGINMQELKSGKLKATPTPFKRASKEDLGPMTELVDDTFKWFIALVVERRKIKVSDVPGLVDGRVYTGRQAVKLALQMKSAARMKRSSGWSKRKRSMKSCRLWRANLKKNYCSIP